MDERGGWKAEIQRELQAAGMPLVDCRETMAPSYKGMDVDALNPAHHARRYLHRVIAIPEVIE